MLLSLTKVIHKSYCSPEVLQDFLLCCMLLGQPSCKCFQRIPSSLWHRIQIQPRAVVDCFANCTDQLIAGGLPITMEMCPKVASNFCLRYHHFSKSFYFIFPDINFPSLPIFAKSAQHSCVLSQKTRSEKLCIVFITAHFSDRIMHCIRRKGRAKLRLPC